MLRAFKLLELDVWVTLALHDLSLAAKLVWREVSKAGLVNIIGTTGHTNASGDIVKKLDVFADETIFKAMDHGGHVCVLASIFDEPSRGS